MYDTLSWKAMVLKTHGKRRIWMETLWRRKQELESCQFSHDPSSRQPQNFCSPLSWFFFFFFFFYLFLAHSETYKDCRKIYGAKWLQALFNNQKRSQDWKDKKGSPNHLLMVTDNVWGLLFAPPVINTYPWVDFHFKSFSYYAESEWY